MHRSHRWRPGQPPPPIRAHSLAKHRLLGGYLRRYVAAYTQNPRHQRLRLMVVDGFAGGNIYTDEATGQFVPGSPGIILDTLQQAVAEVTESRRSPFYFDDRYVFIEKDRHAFGFLQATLASSKHAGRLSREIFPIHGEFSTSLPEIVASLHSIGGGGRAIFVLDQCGYTDVPCQDISLILRTFRNAEVILTFSADSLINYISEESNTDRLCAKTKIDAEPLKRLDKSDPRWHVAAQHLLHNDLQEKTGAAFYTPFFIRSIEANRDIWLIHLSQHVKARDEMGELHWDIQTAAAHYGRAGLNMLGFDPRKIPLDLEARLPGYRFDELAKAATLEALVEDLPRRLRETGEATSFLELFKSVANETPATQRILRESIRSLHQEGLILVRDESGQTSRRSGIQSPKDVIILPAGRTHFFNFGD